MKRFSWFIAIAMLLALTLVPVAGAQDRQVVKDLIMDNKDPFIRFDGDLKFQDKSGVTRWKINYASGIQSASGTFFVPATTCSFATPAFGISETYGTPSVQQGVATFQASRIASNVWTMARMPAQASETYAIDCPLNSWLQLYGGFAGIKITGLRLVYNILGTASAGINPAGLASHYWGALANPVYANWTDPVVGTGFGATTIASGYSGYLATSVAPGAYMTDISVNSPVFFPSTLNESINAEWIVTIPRLIVYRVHGLVVRFLRLDNTN